MTQHEARKDCIRDNFAFRKYSKTYSECDFGIQNRWEIRLVFMLGVLFCFIIIEVREVRSVYTVPATAAEREDGEGRISPRVNQRNFLEVAHECKC